MAQEMALYKVHHSHPLLIFDHQIIFHRISQVASKRSVICTLAMVVSPRYTREFIKMNQDGSIQ